MASGRPNYRLLLVVKRPRMIVKNGGKKRECSRQRKLPVQKSDMFKEQQGGQCGWNCVSRGEKGEGEFGALTVRAL